MADGKDGMDGKDGKDGKDGAGLLDRLLALVDVDGRLQVRSGTRIHTFAAGDVVHLR